MRPNKLIDTHISTPLFDLPLSAIASGMVPYIASAAESAPALYLATAFRTEHRPAMRVPALSGGDLIELKNFGQNLHESTPLWYYVLKEPQVMEKGLCLGPVGGRIVGEVIIGLLQLDRHSYLSDDPHWRPTLPQRNGQVTGNFGMIDFLTFAGVAQFR